MADKVNQLVTGIVEDERQTWEKRFTALCKMQQFIATLLQGVHFTPTGVDSEYDEDHEWRIRMDLDNGDGWLIVTQSLKMDTQFSTGVYPSDSYVCHCDEYNTHVDKAVCAINKCLAADPADPCEHMLIKHGKP